MLLRTVSKEALLMSRKLPSGGGGSRSGSSLISRKDGLRVITGLDGTEAEGGGVGSSLRRATFRRMGGGDNGWRTTLLRSPISSKGAPSARRLLAPEDVDGRTRRRGGTGSPGKVFRDWKDRERAAIGGVVESHALPCKEFPRVRGRSSLLSVA